MSEYQYYEFQAIDRPLNDADRRALRDLSTRARITSTSFTNSYEWGDFKGEPVDLMERWFDMHLYLANWGTRRLMIRFPKRLIDEQRVDGFLGVVDGAELRTSGENLILDILPEESEPDDDDWDDDGSGWLAALTPCHMRIALEPRQGRHHFRPNSLRLDGHQPQQIKEPEITAQHILACNKRSNLRPRSDRSRTSCP